MSQLKIRDQNNPNTWYSIPAGGVGVPAGGSAGDILMKSSETDYSTEWAALAPEQIRPIYVVSTAPAQGAADGIYLVTEE